MSTLVQVITLIEDLISKIETIGFGSDTDEVTHNGITRASVAKSIKDNYAAIQAAVQGRKSFETLTDLNNYTPTADGDGQYPLAEVWKDTTALNNGLYGWDGSAWVKSSYDIPTKIEEINTLFAQASAEVDEVKTRIDNSEEKRGSIRFYQRNGWDDYDADSGHIWQSKTGMQDMFRLGTTILFRASIPWEIMHTNRRFQLSGSGSGIGGRTFSYNLYGSSYFDSELRDTIEVAIGHQSGAYILNVGPLVNKPRDILLLHSTDLGGNVTVSVLNAATGVVEASATTTTTNTTGMALFRSGFSIGAWHGDETAPVGQGQPNTSWCGSIAEMVIVESVVTEAQAVGLIGGIYENIADQTEVTFCRDFSRVRYDQPFAANDSSLPSTTLGVIYPGPSIGISKGLYIEKKPSGYVAGIKPGETAADTEFNIKTDGALDGALLARVTSHGRQITEYMPIGNVSAGVTDYTFIVSIPVNPAWCAIEFKCGNSEFILSDPIAAGIKVSITGQSQLELLLDFDAAAGVQQTSKYPASYCYHNEDNGAAEMYIIDHNPIADGLSGFIHHCNQKAAIPVCILANVKEGSGVDQLCDDSNTERKWSWTEKLTEIAGSDVTAHLYQWGTNNITAGENFGDEILTPLVEGVTSTKVPTLDHYLYDGQTFKRDALFILSPLTGHRTFNEGPFDTDNASSGFSGKSRDSQIEWAAARDIPLGPYTNDLPTSGPHQFSDTPKGNWRLGVRLAEALLRGCGISKRSNPEIESFKWVGSTRNQVDVRVKLPNRGALQTDGGDPKWGFEYDDGTGMTRQGFTAQIINPMTVRLTKETGDWSDTVQFYYQPGGPLAYGTAIDEYETCAGQLYDGVGMDGTAPGDSLGTPVASSNSPYSVS